MRRWFKRIAVAGWVLLAAIQIVRPARTNPAVDVRLALRAFTPPDSPALSVINRACLDCHSNETVWPWYSGVAPVSWLIARDVVEGRKEVNFSEWGSYPLARQQKKFKESCDEVTRGDMPIAMYVRLHPEAKLTDADVRAICDLIQID